MSIIKIDYLVHVQPPSSTHPPVLYYTVTHNVSGNGSELAFNTTTNKAILNKVRYGETYFISVCAVNPIGKGITTILTFSIGKTITSIVCNCYHVMLLLYRSLHCLIILCFVLLYRYDICRYDTNQQLHRRVFRPK